MNVIISVETTAGAERERGLGSLHLLALLNHNNFWTEVQLKFLEV